MFLVMLVTELCWMFTAVSFFQSGNRHIVVVGYVLAGQFKLMLVLELPVPASVLDVAGCAGHGYLRYLIRSSSVARFFDCVHTLSRRQPTLV